MALTLQDVSRIAQLARHDAAAATQVDHQPAADAGALQLRDEHRARVGGQVAKTGVVDVGEVVAIAGLVRGHALRA